MSSSDYTKDVSEAFFSASSETFGNAHATVAELASLRRLFSESGTRDATLASIHEKGYPVPVEITPEMIALTGASHACGVAIHLVETRGLGGKDSTYESYTTKNRFDRFVALHLPKQLRVQWESPIAREVGYKNPKISYPDGVDTRFIYGVAKPSRYLTAQTIRHLEFARLGKLDEATREAMLINDEPIERFTIDWRTFIPIIEAATDTVELAGSIATNIAEQLLSNGLSVEKVAAVLKKSFSIRGIKEEHGEVPEADHVYAALIASLESSTAAAGVAKLLK